MRKISKFLLKNGLFFFVLWLLYAFISDIWNTAPDFAFGLKTKEAKPVSYLPERKARAFPPDSSIVAYFSDKHPFQTGEILQTMGIPNYRCKRLSDANGSKILLLSVDPDDLPEFDKKSLEFIQEYVKNGGTIVSDSGFLGYLDEDDEDFDFTKFFGLKRVIPTQKHTELILAKSPYFKYFNRPEEKEYRLASSPGKIWSNTLVLKDAKALAFYEDNSVAISSRRFGKGEIILLGLHLYDLRFRNLVGRDFNANRVYINHFEPFSDFVPLFLKGLYQKRLKRGFTLSTAPKSYRATVMITHDVDFVDSIVNMKKFYDLERKEGVLATYNIWTKYLKDDKDVPFFYSKYLGNLLEAQKLGFEMGSHTVEHSANFDKFPKGTCKEFYPLYRPFSISYTKDSGNPTVCGELKVSKELLLGAGIKKVVTFRSGELLYNKVLPEVMERFGYRYSSCLSAEDILSYFPYRYMYDYYTLRRPSKIWEFPLVYEDEKLPPLIFRVDQALELVNKIAENGGMFPVLIHPDLTWWKLKNFDLLFLKKFLEGLPKDVGAFTMGAYGEFWDYRDRVVFHYNITPKSVEVTLWSPKNFTLALEPFGWHWRDKIGKGYKIKNGRIVLKLKEGINRWKFSIPSS